jgi:hypothetical protein
VSWTKAWSLYPRKTNVPGFVVRAFQDPLGITNNPRLVDIKAAFFPVEVAWF